MDPHSFLFGFVCGIIVDWTDVLPIMGGICIGYSLQYIGNEHIDKIKEYLNGFVKKPAQIEKKKKT